MPFKKPETYKIILLFVAVLMAGMGVLMFITPPYVIADPISGFQAVRSMQLGGGLNLVIGPSMANISKNSAEFLTWWSPGQYLIPYFFKLLFTINIGQASSITTILCNLLALTGFYCFFKKLGFTKIISALSLLFIVCQQIFWVPYTSYNGGETLLFAFEGWFFYGCVALEKTDIKLLLFVLLSGWIGFICKLSFMWVYGAGLLCLWIRLSAGQTNLIGWVKRGLWLAVPAIISLTVISILFLSKGENPASTTGVFKLTFEAIGFPIASPLLAGFSVDDLLNGLIAPDGPPMFTPTQTILVLLLLAVLSLGLIFAIIRYVPKKNYRLFIITFYSVSLVFFGYSYLRQAVISYEPRHFRTIGLLIVPGVIYLVSRFNLAGKIAFGIVCIIITAKSIDFTIQIYKANRKHIIGASGFSLPFIDQPSLNHLRALDKQTTNAIFVFISGDIGLEILHHRIITLDEYDKNTQNNLEPYHGHAGTIYMLLPISYAGQKATIMCKYFPDYKNFTTTALSKGYVLYTAP